MSDKTDMTVSSSGFAVLKTSPEELTQIIVDNIGPGGLKASDLTTIKVPAGGGTAWEVPGPEGDKSETEICGIIVHKQYRRAYWEDEFAGGNEQPDCSSNDAITGYGNPGGSCDKCEFSKWGSSSKGDGQACRLMQLVFIVREHDLLPIAINLPPTSIKGMRKYLLMLATSGRHHSSVVTKFKLGKEQSASKITYSIVEPILSKVLPGDEASGLRIYSNDIKKSLEGKTDDF